LSLGRDAARPPDRRLAAFGAVLPRVQRLEDSDFDFLTASLGAEASAERRAAAARALAVARLSDAQRSRLLDSIRRAGPLEISALLAPFENADPEWAPRLMDAIKASPGNRAVPLEFQVRLIELLPARSEAERRQEILALKAAAGIDPGRLARIEEELPSGGVQSGQAVFFGRKAACSACHRIGSEGGKIGPDLSKIGERRSERDLLEAIVFPSASIARGFESHAILTSDGLSLTGLIVRETPESVFLRTSDQREVRLKRSDLEAARPSALSIMPAGLENAISRQELADLIAYLRSLK
jgi:putative heme-binding domain-containing protein